MSEFLAGRNVQTTVSVTHERTGPLSRPPDGEEHSACRRLQIVVGKGGVRRTTAKRNEPLFSGLIVDLARRTFPFPLRQQLTRRFTVISEREERCIKILAAFEINAETLIARKAGGPRAEDQAKGCDGERKLF